MRNSLYAFSDLIPVTLLLRAKSMYNANYVGRRDLIFPHHESEIVESETASGDSFARPGFILPW